MVVVSRRCVVGSAIVGRRSTRQRVVRRSLDCNKIWAGALGRRGRERREPPQDLDLDQVQREGEGAVRELFKPSRPPDGDRATEYAARGALLCLGDEAAASGDGWWKAARKFGRRLRLAAALLAVTDAVHSPPAYLLTRRISNAR